jgi:hypothetical protein
MIDVENLDWSRCVYPPFDHQRIGTRALISNQHFALLDEMGSGKTKQVIDAACFMYEAGIIDTVLIICPAQVKSVWVHPQYSQIIEHSFVKGIIHEFSKDTKEVPDRSEGLLWVVVSVEILRQEKHVKTLSTLMKNRKIFGGVDESSTISNHRASQTRGTLNIKKVIAKRFILNGTPIGQSILNLWSQFEFLDPLILGFKNYFTFRNHHCQMGGYMHKQVIAYHDIEGLQNKIKPYALRRLKKDCLDILPKMRSPLIEVRLTPATWEKYVSMREEFVAYLNSSDEASIVTTAPVKSLRLAQICSGFLGGFLDDEDDGSTTTVEISSELTDAYLDNLEFRLREDPDLRLITWCRFRAEIARLERRVRARFPNLQVEVLQGGLSKTDREKATFLFHPDNTDLKGPALLIGQPQAGRFGSNFSKCQLVDYLSNDYSFITRSQSEDRVHRPGQRFQVLLQDYLVVGPNRERTVSGIILKNLRNHEDFANWTASKWVAELYQEENDVPF